MASAAGEPQTSLNGVREAEGAQRGLYEAILGLCLVSVRKRLSLGFPETGQLAVEVANIKFAEFWPRDQPLGEEVIREKTTVLDRSYREGELPVVGHVRPVGLGGLVEEALGLGSLLWTPRPPRNLRVRSDHEVLTLNERGGAIGERAYPSVRVALPDRGDQTRALLCGLGRRERLDLHRRAMVGIEIAKGDLDRRRQLAGRDVMTEPFVVSPVSTVGLGPDVRVSSARIRPPPLALCGFRRIAPGGSPPKAPQSAGVHHLELAGCARRPSIADWRTLTVSRRSPLGNAYPWTSKDAPHS